MPTDEDVKKMLNAFVQNVSSDNHTVEKEPLNLAKITSSKPTSSTTVSMPKMVGQKVVGAPSQGLPAPTLQYVHVHDMSGANNGRLLSQESHGKRVSLVLKTDGLYVTSGEDAMPIFKGRLTIKKEIRKIRQNGTMDIDYEMLATVNEMIAESFKISRKSYQLAMRKKLHEHIPEFILCTDTQGFSAYFGEYLSAILSKKNFPVEYHFDFCGWTTIDDKRHVYLHGGMPGVDAKIKLPLSNHLDICEGLNAFRDLLFGHAGLYIVFLYAHLGFCAQLFKDADLAAHFSFYLSGESGSFKTTLLELLGVDLFGEGRMMYGRFSDTTAALMAKMKAHMHRNFLVDDYNPTTNSDEKSKMEKNRSLLIRCYGDTKSSDKLSPNRQDVVSEPICGALWMTGENDDFQTFSESLRVVVVHIERGTIDSKKLALVSANKLLLSRYFAEFVKWLSLNYEAVVANIRSQKEIKRNEWQARLGMEAGRFVDAATVLDLLNSIIWHAAGGAGVPNIEAEEANGRQKIALSFESELSRVKVADPRKLLAAMIADIIANKKLDIVDNDELYKQSHGVGYFNDDKTLLVVHRTAIKEAVNRECIRRSLASININKKILLKNGLITGRIKGPYRYDFFRTNVYEFFVSKLTDSLEEEE